MGVILPFLYSVGKHTWIDASTLEALILSAQDTESGGIADRQAMCLMFSIHYLAWPVRNMVQSQTNPKFQLLGRPIIIGIPGTGGP